MIGGPRALPVIATLALFVSASTASARITPAEYRAIGVTLSSGASLPLSTEFVDEAGHSRHLSEIISLPTVLIFADFNCQTLCGPAIAFVADALEQSGLRGDQYRLVVIGLNPDHAPGSAASAWRTHLTGGVIDAAIFLTGDAASVASVTAAVGYRYQYDPDAAQYVHPAAAFVVTADGRVSQALTELGLSARDLRLALVEAGQGRIGSLSDEIRLLCSAFDPQHGTYNLAVSRLLAGAGGLTIALLGCAIGLLWRAERRTSDR
jgi:protein SCO1